MAISFISVWTLIARTVLSSISIEVEPLLIEFGKSGVDISCVVNGTNLIGITNILLKRSESYVVSVTKFKIAWQDKALDNKTGVTVNASISNTMTSYLRLEISKTAVRFPEDVGSYQCILSAFTASGDIKQYRSQSVVLNITGFLESTTNLFSTTNYKNTEVSVQKVA
uniref:Ig-like domain-containing protein n=1 Tax=Magallana gigas TaxID=29159 RepID=A0A8W8J9D3_MAGGI